MVGCLLVAERRVVAPPNLLQFVVVAQREQCALDEAHLLHFTHDVFVDAVHDLLVRSKRKPRLERRTRGEPLRRRWREEP